MTICIIELTDTFRKLLIQIQKFHFISGSTSGTIGNSTTIVYIALHNAVQWGMFSTPGDIKINVGEGHWENS